MGMFTKPEYIFAVAVASAEKFIAQFEKAASAAEKELVEVDVNLAKEIDRCDEAIEKAYSEYMKAESKYNHKSDTALYIAEERKAILNDVKEKAQAASANFRKLFSV